MPAAVLNEAPLRCKTCSAISIQLEGPEASHHYNVPLSVWRQLFGTRRPPKKTLWGCDYCVNGYGVDLCGCGSKEKFGSCDGNYTDCAHPSQILNLDQYLDTTPPPPPVPERPPEGLMPWVYVHLWRGRSIPAESTDEFGADGPAFAANFVNIEYRGNIRLNNVWADSAADRNEGWIRWVGDCLYYDGRFYGDVSFHSREDETFKNFLTKFEGSKAQVPDIIPAESPSKPERARRKKVLVEG